MLNNTELITAISKREIRFKGNYLVLSYDYSNKATPDELCRFIGIYKRHL